jgi:RimJ/RimL family protein N-acetyltransferase
VSNDRDTADQTDLRIRPFAMSDLPAFKALRLESLRAHPAAFGSDYDESLAKSDAEWEQFLRSSVDGREARLFLAEAADGLAGMTGVYRERGAKVRHSANLWGVYVRPPWRGRRLTDRLIDAALAWCADGGVRIVRLGVGTYNAPAIRCYRRCGFEVYGVLPEVIRVGDLYHDELLMWRRV